MVGTLLSSPTTADGAAVYWNPAAMTELRGSHLLAYGGISIIQMRYQRDTPSAFDGSFFPESSIAALKPGPAIGVVTDAGLRDFRFGAAFVIPNIFGGVWPEQNEGMPTPTRYYGIRIATADLYFETAAAWRINRYVSVGVGVDVIGMLVEHSAMTDMGARINQLACASVPSACMDDAPLAREDPAFDALTTAEGLGWGVGVYAGVLVRPAPWMRLGLTVHSGAGTIDVPLDVKVAMPTAITDYVGNNLPAIRLPDITAEATMSIASPTSIACGVAFELTRKLELGFDYRWRDESRSSALHATIVRSSNELLSEVVTYKPQTDVHRVAAHVAYALLPRLTLATRFEYGGNTRSEVFSTPINVDTTKLLTYIGAIWRVSKKVAVSAEYGHFFFFSQTVRRSFFAPNAFASTPEEQFLDKPPPTGRYTGFGDHFGLSLRLDF